jgi:transcriptional regulator with XRE-family HTH domain
MYALLVFFTWKWKRRCLKVTLLTEKKQPDVSPVEEDEEVTIAPLVRKLMDKRKRLPSQLAADIGVSHTTIARWLSGKSIPSPYSCSRLADYGYIPLQKVLSMAGHIPRTVHYVSPELPEFREYALCKYPAELDEEMITIIEDLIERRRAKGHRRYN